jgi:N6-adenosine-specific RNA methylase IME4
VKIQLTNAGIDPSQAEQKFSTILADPPWRFTNRTGKVAPEHRRLSRYDTMSIDDICALDVEGLAAKNSHLYLWVPNALLPDGLRTMEAWGFRYVSNLIWAKRRKDGGPDGRGVGFYFRNVTEILLFGVRGSLRTLPPARSQVNMIESRKREHSRKPDEQYDLIESCSPGPYLELFARSPRSGWASWGDEADPNIEQRGKVHASYRGGPLIQPYQRLNALETETLSRDVATRYLEDEKSIRQISTEMGLSIGRVRTILSVAGVSFRPRGKSTTT